MRLRWNPAGKGIKTIPSELEQFARSKRREFFLNMLVSAAAGIALTLKLEHDLHERKLQVGLSRQCLSQRLA